MTNNSKIQVISRAAAILRALGNQGQSLGELAKRTDLPRSTVQRIVDALAAENLVDTGESGVRLSWGLNELARQSYSPVASHLRRPLEKLFESTRETVDVSTCYGNDVHFLDRIVSDQVLRVVPGSNQPRPLYAMANGKAMLACMTDEEITALLRPGLIPLTAATITSLEQLLAEIRQVRESGFSYDREEHAEGICAIGIPLPFTGSQPYAMSVVIPAFRYGQHLDAIKTALNQARRESLEILARLSDNRQGAALTDRG